MSFKQKEFKPENLTEAVGGCFMIMKRYINRYLEQSNLGMTMEQIIILFILEDNDGLNISQLAKLSDRDKTTTTRMVDGLQKRNMVVKVPDKKDNRQKLVYKTNLANQKIEELKKTAMPELEKIAYKNLDEEERNRTIKVLQKMAENMTLED
ncbi:MAG: MarR family winged helix-turn-helix transcriptional regulator [Candidatus Zixiibacteriota bacterium]